MPPSSTPPTRSLITNDSGLLALANEQTELLFGYERAELLGQPVELLVPDRLVPAHLQHRNEFMQAPRVRLVGLGLDLAGWRKNGSEFPVHISLGPPELDGRPFVIATVRDITERLRAQDETRQLDELRRRRQDALELNDSVVQQLAAARLALGLGDKASRRQADRTRTARRTVLPVMTGKTTTRKRSTRPALRSTRHS